MSKVFDRLFSAVKIGDLEIKNRVAMTAMGVNLAALGGGVNDDILAFYEARARGGVGLVMSGICRVMDGTGAGEHCQVAARDARDIQGLGRLEERVRKHGARLFLQLHHPGWNYTGAEQPVAASAVEHPFGGRTPRELTVPEIKTIQTAFINGARIAQAAGVDGIELHGAHGYLINSFLSPHLNFRKDAYGGSFDNRMRFLLEIIAGIRAAVGKRFPVGVRISAEEFLGSQAGNDLAASSRMAVVLEQAGIDFLDVSCIGFSPGSPGLTACIEPGTYPQGWKKYMAAEIRRHVKIPVIAVANIKEPQVAETMLEDGCCDLVGVARGHLADPDWCNKALTGRAAEIRRCIGCLVCFEEIEHGRHVRCSVNPVTGREREFASPARNGGGRTVAVVGGGPAGITAALVLKERGFHPVLLDHAGQLGGTLHIADKGIDREKIARFCDDLRADVERSEVEVRTGVEVTVDEVRRLSPCGVFIAMGAEPFIPSVPGADGANVMTAEDILMHRAEASGSSVVIGSGMTGLETAEVLGKQGHKTTVVDMLPQIGLGAEPIIMTDILQRLSAYGTQFMPGHRLLRISEKGVELECVASGKPAFVSADTVVLALGVRPSRHVELFRVAFPDARIIGDAAHGGRIVDATSTAYEQAFVFEPTLSAGD